MELFGKVVDLFYKTVDLLNEIEDIFSKIKQNNGPFSTNLCIFYLERAVLQHLENPPGYGLVHITLAIHSKFINKLPLTHSSLH